MLYRITRIVAVAFFLCGAFAWPAPGQTPTDTPTPVPNEQFIVAIVGDHPIFKNEIEASLVALRKANQVGEGNEDFIKAQLLDQLVIRNLAALQLADDKTLIRPGEMEKNIEGAEEAARKQGMTLEEFTQKNGISLDAIRMNILWQIVSAKYLGRHLNDAVEKYYEEHHQELDGTELRASQIVLRPLRYNETPAQVEARAAKLREEIVSGKLDFTTAARKFSFAPSSDKGGDVGFVPRQGVMQENFGAALYKLKKGEISPPFTTPFGTHLVQATEAKPGTRSKADLLPQIKQLAAAEILKQLAAKQHEISSVVYTGRMPYIKPGTRDLVVTGESLTLPPTKSEPSTETVPN